MKKTIFFAKHIPANIFLATLYMFVIFFLTSCKKDPHTLIVALTHPPFHIENAKLQFPTEQSELLWNNRGHIPIMAPDGHQVTFGEFNKVSGYAEVSCHPQGTKITVHVKDLIPNGTYSIWLLTFKDPGFDGTFVNQIGFGAAGLADGSTNVVKASSHGTAEITTITPGGPLSIFGSVGDCLLSEFEVHIAAAFHLDDLSHGAVPGPPGTWVAQAAFPFKGNP